ncbi:hypothetical protein DL765_004776 [Monosporascus sp. GIB2]|nr:hypothetical protein DL765_004776 [Monosporascus sp. GIB2]
MAKHGTSHCQPERKWATRCAKLFRKFECEWLQLINGYGPAEITMVCARGLLPYRTDADVLASSDYLRPWPNYSMGIRDQQLNIVPVGFPGEVCISGPSTALGYLNRAEETKQKFVEVDLGVDPDNNDNNTGRRTKPYRSGDFGRILPDGTLWVLGRLDGDSQVKIHGTRVELGEIADVIVEASNGAISNATVSLRRPPEILAAPSESNSPIA